MVDLPKPSAPTQSINLAERIISAKSESVYRAFSVMSWAAAVALLISLPLLFFRENTNFVLVFSLVTGALTLDRVYRWQAKKRLTPRYMLLLSVGLILLGLLGFLSYGVAAGAFPTLLLGTLSIMTLETNFYLKRYIVPFILLSIVAISFSLIDYPIPEVKPEDHVRFIRSGMQNGFYFISALAATVVLYFMLIPFRSAALELGALLEKEERTLTSKQIDTETAEGEVFNVIPGFVVELDNNSNIVAFSREAAKFVGLTLNSQRHLSETRLTTIPEVNQIIAFSEQTKSNYSTEVSVPWMGDGLFRIELTRVGLDQENTHYLLSLESKVDDNLNERTLLAQHMDALMARQDGLTRCRAVLTCQTGEISDPMPLFQKVLQDLSTQIDLISPPIYERQDREVSRVGLVFDSKTQLDACITILKQSHAVLAEQNQLIPTGCATAELEQPSSTELIKRSELSLMEGRKFAENGWFLYDTMMPAGWDNLERAALIRAMRENQIQLTPCKLISADPCLKTMVQFHALWPNSPYPSHKLSSGLNQALERYELLKDTPITDVNTVLVNAHQYLESHPEHLVLIRVPDALVNDDITFATAYSILKELDMSSRLVIRISEQAAAKVSDPTWEILNKLRNIGVQFALGDIGSGDTDIHLLSNTIFAFLHFNTHVTELGLVNEKNQIILRELLTLAAKLGKPSIAKSTPERSMDLLKLGTTYVDIS